MRPDRHSFALTLLISLLMLFSLTACEVLVSQFLSPSERTRLEADRLLSDDRQAEALLAFRQAVELDPKNVPALQSLGALYAQQGRLRLAHRYLFKAQVAQPQNAQIKAALAALPTPAPSTAPLNLLWQVELCEGEPLGFVFQGPNLFVAMDTGTLLSLDAASGKTNWTVKLPVRLTSAPTISADHLWVGAQDGVLYALSPTDGSQLWKFATSAPIYAPPTLSGELLYLASGDGNLYALNAKTGTAVWMAQTGSPLHAQPTVADGVVFFGSNNTRLYAVDAFTGQPFWKDGILTQGAVESPVVVADGRVYFGSGDARLYCLAQASGGEYWRVSLGDAVFARPIVLDGTVYAASAGNTLAAIDTLTGVKQWEVRAPSALTTSPLVNGDVIYYVASGDPHLYAVERKTGQPLWNLDTGDWLVGPPQIMDGILYLAGKDGAILAYR